VIAGFGRQQLGKCRVEFEREFHWFRRSVNVLVARRLLAIALRPPARRFRELTR
jgi:hypothetical protein